MQTTTDTPNTDRLYRLRLYELECPADDFDTESGQGMPEDAEPYELEDVTVPASLVLATLADWGVSQWDGGSTAYDPDGSHMSPSGVITERFASVAFQS